MHWYPCWFLFSSLCNWPCSRVCPVYNIGSCFQLSSLCNWLSAWVCPVYNIPSWGVKSTSAVLWSSANFCSISQNMHPKAAVALQHWKTNKVVWTWKDDWLPWRTSTYKRLLLKRVTILFYVVIDMLIYICFVFQPFYSYSNGCISFTRKLKVLISNVYKNLKFMCCLLVGHPCLVTLWQKQVQMTWAPGISIETGIWLALIVFKFILTRPPSNIKEFHYYNEIQNSSMEIMEFQR